MVCKHKYGKYEIGGEGTIKQNFGTCPICANEDYNKIVKEVDDDKREKLLKKHLKKYHNR